jgi:hypothetical protein
MSELEKKLTAELEVERARVAQLREYAATLLDILREDARQAHDAGETDEELEVLTRVNALAAALSTSPNAWPREKQLESTLRSLVAVTGPQNVTVRQVWEDAKAALSTSSDAWREQLEKSIRADERAKCEAEMAEFDAALAEDLSDLTPEEEATGKPMPCAQCEGSDQHNPVERMHEQAAQLDAQGRKS